MIYLFYAVHIVLCLFLILVVLLQQGKGADLSVFGGGSTMTAFGARGAATLLHKLTVYGFIGFIVTTLSIGVLQGRQGSSSVMSDVPAAAQSDGDEATGEEAALEPALAEEDAPVAGALEEADEPLDESVPEIAPAESGDTSGDGGDGSGGS